jgi:dehydrogenase/reductase SDR family member 1
MKLAGKVAVVTGASRGIGRGIALELGHAGATVYISGRTTANGDVRWPGSIDETAAAVTRDGGRGIAVRCDHGDDEQVAELFAQVRREHGRLDVLVNNASAFGDTADGYPVDGVPFWQAPTWQWDAMHAVGLRSHYVAAALAAPLMLAQRAGLIVNVSSAGAASYVFNAAYGAAKAALDKLSADMAHELRDHGVTALSLWPPFTRTEKYVARLDAATLQRARSPQFSGRAVVALACDPNVIAKSGQALRVTDLADAYGFTDTSG